MEGELTVARSEFSPGEEPIVLSILTWAALLADAVMRLKADHSWSDEEIREVQAILEDEFKYVLEVGLEESSNMPSPIYEPVTYLEAYLRGTPWKPLRRGSHVK